MSRAEMPAPIDASPCQRLLVFPRPNSPRHNLNHRCSIPHFSSALIRQVQVHSLSRRQIFCGHDAPWRQAPPPLHPPSPPAPARPSSFAPGAPGEATYVLRLNSDSALATETGTLAIRVQVPPSSFGGYSSVWPVPVGRSAPSVLSLVLEIFRVGLS